MRYSLEITKLNFKAENLLPTPLLLTPEPQKIEYLTGAIDFNASFQIATNLPQESKYILEHLIDEIKRYINKRITIPISYDLDPLEITPFQQEIKNLTNKQQERFSQEGYVLEITKNAPIVRIWAESLNGIFYGIQTIYQIINNTRSKGLYLPSLRIMDFPDMEIRGVSDDISRGQAITKEGLKRFIVELSRYKMNHYFLYIEDTFKFEKHPTIGVNRGAFSKQDIVELTQFAHQYSITLSPIFESLGHMDNILSLSQYHHLAEFPSSDCINVADPESYRFLEDLYAELAPAFTSSHFNLACDESWELGKYRSHDLVQKLGIGQVYLQHYQKIFALAKKYGKENIYLYHDIAVKYNEVLAGLPKEIIFCYWDYAPRAKYPKIDTIVNAGFRFVVKPSVHDYRTFFSEITTTENNTQNLIQYGAERGALGVIQSSWGDFRNEPLHDNRLYGFVLAGTMAWNLKKFDKLTFWKGICLHFFESDNDQILEVIQILRNILDQNLLGRSANFFRLWAHPFAWPTIEHMTKDFIPICNRIEDAQKKCTQIEAQAPRNINNVAALRYSLQLYRLYAQKELLTVKIQRSELWKKSKEKKDYLIAECDALAKMFLASREEYRTIWMKTSSDANLSEILDNYTAIATIFQKKIIEIEQDLTWQNPNIPSHWIYSCQKKQPYQKLDTIFRKDIQLDSKPTSAFLQVICDSHAIIYVNGDQIGEMFSKRTLSILMLNRTVQIYNIASHLRAGKNTITIHNMNYLGGIGCINVYGEIADQNGYPNQIISDTTWSACSKPNPDWISGKIEIKNITMRDQPVKSLGIPPFVNGSLTYPDFSNAKPSYHTLMLGIANVGFPHIPLWTFGILKWISKKAVNKGFIV